MEKRTIVCSKCGRKTTVTKDTVPPGWIIDDPGWAVVNYSPVCFLCRKKEV